MEGPDEGKKSAAEEIRQAVAEGADLTLRFLLLSCNIVANEGSRESRAKFSCPLPLAHSTFSLSGRREKLGAVKAGKQF